MDLKGGVYMYIMRIACCSFIGAFIGGLIGKYSYIFIKKLKNYKKES